MFCALTYLFGHSIYFARLCHVNPQCKHKCAFLQMKEAPNQKVQEKKPLLKFKNTKENMCLERIWKKCFRHRPLIFMVIILIFMVIIFKFIVIIFIFTIIIFNNGIHVDDVYLHLITVSLIILKILFIVIVPMNVIHVDNVFSS